MAVTHIIFDMDGTLVDTIGGIAYCCNYVLEKHGYPTHTVESYKQFVGNGLRNTIKNALAANQLIGNLYDSEIDQMVIELHERYEDDYLHDTQLFEGIEELLDFIESKGILWGIHTNKKTSIAQKIADSYFSQRNYLGLYGLSDENPGKPHPYGALQLIGNQDKVDEVLYIGDTEVDIETAKNFGAIPLSVAWGFRPAEKLQELNENPIIYFPKDILRYL